MSATRKHVFTFAVLIFGFLRFVSAQTEAPRATIPANTEVEIQLLENISSETLQAGQSVAFKVVKPVVVNGTTVLRVDTPLSGEVKAVQTSRHWGRGGSFDLVLKPIRLDDGSLAQLDFHRPRLVSTKLTKGQKVATAAASPLIAGLALYYFPLIPPAMIESSKKGKPYNIRSGERYLVYVVSSPSSSDTTPPQATQTPKP
jgi:hypothetical protein